MPSEWAKDAEAHDRYEQLIALYSTGELSDVEVQELTDHVRLCESCREGLGKYRTLFRHIGPVAFTGKKAPTKAWAPELKQKVLHNFVRLQEDPSLIPDRIEDKRSKDERLFTATWKKNAVVGALCLLLVATGVLLAKRNNRVQKANAIFNVAADSKTTAIEESRRLQRDLQDRAQLISSLEKQVKEQESQITELKNQLSHLKDQRQGALNSQEQLTAENSSLSEGQQKLTNRLHDQEAALGVSQQQLHDLQSQHASDLVESAHQQGEIASLKAQIHDRDAAIEQQQQLLASDRDIRELMGARELTIAEISDFDQNAQKRKPFGRVFFTKDKSLVFYAFDLEKQKGLQKATAFQAWGVDSSNRNTAVNLGILYKDSESNRRWTLKFDDPEVLAKIDAIFVTIEPNGGSLKPSGKQLLYAFLRTQPNHP